MTSRTELVKYINNCITLNKIVSNDEAHCIADEIFPNSSHRITLAKLLKGSVMFDTFFLKMEGDVISLVYCSPSYESIDFADYIDIIGNYAFYNNILIREVSGKGIKEIGKSSFRYSGIKSASLTNLRQIDEYAFSDCSLETIFAPKVEDIGRFGFARCLSLRRAEMRPISIDDYAFSHCKNLTYINCHRLAVTGMDVFLDCEKLKANY